jgi:SNF2 family DNA or RNA helicase
MSTWGYWATNDSVSISPVSEEEYRERERQRAEAEDKAEKILAENLDEEQKKVYAERKVIPITTAKGRKYLIKRGRVGNVYRIDERGKEVEKFCIHPDEAVPDQDCMLAQLLWLRWMEDEFLRVANKTQLAA